MDKNTLRQKIKARFPKIRITGDTDTGIGARLDYEGITVGWVKTNALSSRHISYVIYTREHAYKTKNGSTNKVKTLIARIAEGIDAAIARAAKVKEENERSAIAKQEREKERLSRLERAAVARANVTRKMSQLGFDASEWVPGGNMSHTMQSPNGREIAVLADDGSLQFRVSLPALSPDEYAKIKEILG